MKPPRCSDAVVVLAERYQIGITTRRFLRRQGGGRSYPYTEDPMMDRTTGGGDQSISRSALNEADSFFLPILTASPHTANPKMVKGICHTMKFMCV